MKEELAKLWTRMGQTRAKITVLKTELEAEKQALASQNDQFYILLDKELGLDPEDESIEAETKRYQYINTLQKGE